MAHSPRGDDSIPAIENIVIRETGTHKATIVFLHGLGDSGRGVQNFFTYDPDAPQLLEHPHLRWVFPSASAREVTCNQGRTMPSWFDVFRLREGSREDNEGIDKAAQGIARILREERDTAPGVKLILGGISQGGAVALHLTTRKFAGTFLDGTDASSVPMDATICLSGWLIAENERVTMRSAEETKKYPIVYCHGAGDPTVAFDWGRNSANILRSLGFSSLKFMSYDDLVHSTSPEELEDVKKWIERQCRKSYFGWALPILPFRWKM